MLYRMTCWHERWRKRKRCKKPHLTILMSHTKCGVTILGEIMDITLHIGGREFFQLSGKDALGNVDSLKGATITESTLDPAIATITANPADATVVAVDGTAVGSTVGTILLTNSDGTAAQPVTLSITVLADDVVEVDAVQIGAEVAGGTPFPGATPPAPPIAPLPSPTGSAK